MKKTRSFIFSIAALFFISAGLPDESRPVSSQYFNDYELRMYESLPSDEDDLNSNLDNLKRLRADQYVNLTDFISLQNNFQMPRNIISSNYAADINQIKGMIESVENAGTQDLMELNTAVGIFRRNYFNFSYTSTYYEGTAPNPELTRFKNDFNKDVDSLLALFPGAAQMNAITEVYYDQSLTVKNKLNAYKTIITGISAIKVDILSQAYSKLCANKKKEIDIIIKEIENRISRIDQLIKQYKDKKKEMNQEINEWGIKRGLPWFCGTVAFLFLVTVVSRYMPFRRKKAPGSDGADNDARNEHISKVLVEVITVLLLTLTILILGLSNILKENVLGTLIGGIAAYILNRAKNVHSETSDTPKPAPKNTTTTASATTSTTESTDTTTNTDKTNT
jgi:hypothetical protein